MGLLNRRLRAFLTRGLLTLCVTTLFCVFEVSTAQTAGEIDMQLYPTETASPGDTIEVFLNIINSSEYKLGAVFFLVQYDSLGLRLLDGGPVSSECPWFIHLTVELRPGVVRAIGAMEFPDFCPLDDNGNPAWRLRFVVNDDQNLNGYILPLEFTWHDCNDNQLSDDLGLHVVTSNSIYRWYDDQNSVSHDSELPTIFGRPEGCGFNEVVVDIMNFYSSSIQVGEPGLRDFGDVNLNGIPYEIADAMLFAAYLREGLQAFTIDPSAQLQASDVDADLRPGTLADFVYLLQVIRAEAPPTNGWRGTRANHTAYVTHHLDTRSISFDWPDSAAALFLRFSGDVEITSTNIPFQLETINSTGNTRMLLLPGIDDPELLLFAGNIEIEYSGIGRLTEVQLADLDFHKIPVVISRIPGNQTVCGDVSGDKIVTLSDVSFIMSYIFGGGPAPDNESLVDPNCSGSLSVSDAVLIINYIFASGPGPCSQCD
jgi:hypothetical protein